MRRPLKTFSLHELITQQMFCEHSIQKSAQKLLLMNCNPAYNKGYYEVIHEEGTAHILMLNRINTELTNRRNKLSQKKS